MEQYTDCKHCGKSLMEGEIHNCRQMLLAEIADCHASMMRQGEKIVRLEKALGRIARWNELPDDPCWDEIAREALADRP